MNYYLDVLKKYAVFSGRARRKEYWFFVLFNAIAGILLMVVDVMVGTYDPETQSGVISSLYSLAVFIPSIAVTVRRLHDTDRSGWWVMLPIGVLIGGGILLAVTLSGNQNAEQLSPAASVVMGLFGLTVLGSFIALFVFMVLDGTTGSNRFGEDPKIHEILGSHRQKPPVQSSEKTVAHSNPATVTLTGEGAGVDPIQLHPNQKIIVGRSGSADIKIDNQHVSNQHISITLSDGGTVSVIDLGSSNGTYIQGSKLAAHIPHIVHPGDRIILGSEDVVYRL